MSLISHANSLPWLVQPGFFMTLTRLLVNGLFAITAVSLLYRILHRLLSHPVSDLTPVQHDGGIGGTSQKVQSLTLPRSQAEDADHED
ncbi:MAG: hypothetical protein ABW101_17380 [Candidatus Thiodiazotropha sp.]